MTAEIRPVTVLFEADRLILELHHDSEGAYHAFPGEGGPGEGAGGGSVGVPRVALSLAEALHARIRPAGTAETVL
ncbi:NUDIX hydrolase, partial [Streptomyces sp. SID724]|nr:NUDIX hydrolase [Streptomyces sp. SID724]